MESRARASVESWVSARTTVTERARRSLVRERPMPFPAPVMIAVLPLSLKRGSLYAVAAVRRGTATIVTEVWTVGVQK